MAPPKRTTFVLLTRVMVCPNLAMGTSPYTSNSSTAGPYLLAFPAPGEGVPAADYIAPAASMLVIEVVAIPAILSPTKVPVGRPPAEAL